MNSATHEFVTVDMRSLKAALVARAQAERVSVSVVVRRAVERQLELADASSERKASTGPPAPVSSIVKLSIRLTSAEAEQLTTGARRAGLSRGAFFAGLLASAPSSTAGLLSRPDFLAALSASCAELSTLSRNLHHLTSLLREGQVRAALEYRQMLVTLEGDVRAHLRLASGALAELRPPRQVRPHAEPGADRPHVT